MSNFNIIKSAVSAQFNQMCKAEVLFEVDVDKDELWQIYLNSFPAGTNPIYKERTDHDCQCCRQFINRAGGVVTIKNDQLVSIWDVDCGDSFYQVVANAMSEVVKSKPIRNVFIHYEKNLGTDKNHQQLEDGEIITWDHFYYKLPARFTNKKESLGSILGEVQSTKQVFERSLKEITNEAIDIVLDLIDQNSLYRGKEHKGIVEVLQLHKRAYDVLEDSKKDLYLWSASAEIGMAARFRNTVIGTLLVDISEGAELDRAVASFESKVAPQNYKRPTAVVTKKMIENAQAKINELGIEASLHRRYARLDDITVNNLLFVDRNTKKNMNVFDEMMDEAHEKAPNFDKVEEVDVDTFVNNILPKADKVELYVENRHINNLFSLIAPVDKDAPNILRWNNNFSWTYNGEVTDSIKERVKRAGGSVEGFLRCSLSWYNYDDLDIHCVEPDGHHIYYGNKHSHRTNGELDVDMNAGGGTTREPVENIIWPHKEKMAEGIYQFYVNQFCKRENVDVGFEIEMELDGQTFNFTYDKAVVNNVLVAELKYSRENGFEFVKKHLPQTSSSKTVWNIATQKFQKVNMVLNSPNHWDGQSIGNKHLFFVIDKCKNEESSRGLYNEFLKSSLEEHRKVFEVLGNKLKTPKSDDQLSGLGFSTTKHDSLICRVGGSFNRTIKINL